MALNKNLLYWVQLCEDRYGTLDDAPFFCDELKETRKLYPNKGHQMSFTHPYIEEVKRDYEDGYGIAEINAHYHIRADRARLFSKIYNWKRPKINGRPKKYKKA